MKQIAVCSEIVMPYAKGKGIRNLYQIEVACLLFLLFRKRKK